MLSLQRIEEIKRKSKESHGCECCSDYPELLKDWEIFYAFVLKASYAVSVSESHDHLIKDVLAFQEEAATLLTDKCPHTFSFRQGLTRECIYCRETKEVPR